jgi:hypothetical protein
MSDNFWTAVYGLAVGVAVGAAVLGFGQAHGAGKDPIVMNDARVPTYVYTATVGTILWDWDHALQDRGPEAGIRWKDNMSRYLEGLVHGFYVASAESDRLWGRPKYCMGDGKRTILGGEVIQMLKEYGNINPYANVWPFQVAVYHILGQIYPCPSQAAEK